MYVLSHIAVLDLLWWNASVTSCGLLLRLTFVGDLPGHLKEQQVFHRQLILLPGRQHPTQRRHGQGTRQRHLDASGGAPTDSSRNVKQICSSCKRDPSNRPQGEGSWAEQGQSPRTQQDKITGNHESKELPPRLLGLTLYSQTHMHTQDAHTQDIAWNSQCC